MGEGERRGRREEEEWRREERGEGRGEGKGEGTAVKYTLSSYGNDKLSKHLPLHLTTPSHPHTLTPPPSISQHPHTLTPSHPHTSSLHLTTPSHPHTLTPPPSISQHPHTLTQCSLVYPCVQRLPARRAAPCRLGPARRH